MRTRSVLNHSAKALAEGSLIALLAVGLMAGTTLAAKGGGGASKPSGGGGGGSSLVLAMVSDANTNGLPNNGDVVTFTVSTTATDKPWVKLNCSAAGTWVYTSSAGFFPAYAWPANFTLSATGWSSGAGDCTATLYYVTSNGRNSTLGTLAFHVDS